ncbi:hypothetical protein EJ02DRAFT_185528 [Clathrospora elynae]|uniref:Uncharacterized protein n=1 Tax=Clathrospora elynae TaxID=706981 RepID=A0A6A5SQA8_9PLEO|nr:hypothetical protein EJ02DRAFT_185528 [Clathrospora elynae]
MEAPSFGMVRQSKPLHKVALPKYSYIFRRIYLCGQPDEYIAVSQFLDHRHIIHNLVSLADYNQWASDCKCRLVYSLERCQ